MKQSYKIISTLSISVGLILILIPFSMLIGWNLITATLFWLIIIPAVTIYLPQLISKNKDHLWESLIGMTIFYAFMVFMIYDHYKTDYFKLIMVSFVVNMMVVLMILSAKRHRKLTANNQNNTFHLQI